MKMYAVFTHSGSYEDYRSVLRFVTKRKWVADNWVKRYNKLLLKLKDHQLDMSHNYNFSEDEKINRNMRWRELMYTHEAYIHEIEKR